MLQDVFCMRFDRGGTFGGDLHSVYRSKSAAAIQKQTEEIMTHGRVKAVDGIIKAREFTDVIV